MSPRRDTTGRWAGKRVTVNVWDLHVLVSLAHSARYDFLDRAYIDAMNRVVRALAAAKEV